MTDSTTPTDAEQMAWLDAHPLPKQPWDDDNYMLSRHDLREYPAEREALGRYLAETLRYIDQTQACHDEVWKYIILTEAGGGPVEERAIAADSLLDAAKARRNHLINLILGPND